MDGADGTDGKGGVNVECDVDAHESTVRRQLALTTVLVRDYDEGIAFFVDALGFALVEDVRLVEADGERRAKRWVVVAPSAEPGAALLLAERA